MDSFRNFAYISNYLHLKSFAWERGFQYLQNYKRHESGKDHSRKPLKSSKSHIQIEDFKTIRLLFKGS